MSEACVLLRFRDGWDTETDLRLETLHKTIVAMGERDGYEREKSRTFDAASPGKCPSHGSFQSSSKYTGRVGEEYTTYISGAAIISD